MNIFDKIEVLNPEYSFFRELTNLDKIHYLLEIYDIVWENLFKLSILSILSSASQSVLLFSYKLLLPNFSSSTKIDVSAEIFSTVLLEAKFGLLSGFKENKCDPWTLRGYEQAKK